MRHFAYNVLNTLEALVWDVARGIGPRAFDGMFGGRGKWSRKEMVKPFDSLLC